MTSLYDCGQTLAGRVFSEPAKPAPVHNNDLWFNTLTSAWSLYSGGKWNPLTPAGGAGLTFPAPVDTSLPIVPGVTHSSGAIIVHPGPDGATVDASYTGAGGQTINKGDWLIFDGASWHLLHTAANALTKITYAVQALPTDPLGIGSAWTALVAKPTDTIILATFNGDTYLKTGAGGADADWTLIESPFAVADAPEMATGTDNVKAVSPLRFATELNRVLGITEAFRATGSVITSGGPPAAANAGKPVGLNPAGIVDPALLPPTTSITAPLAPNLAGIGAAWTALGAKPTDPIVFATFQGDTYYKTGAGGADADWLLVETPLPGSLGAIDTTAAYAVPATAPKPGAVATVQTAGAAHPSWGAVGVAGTLAAGDLLIWDGTQYHVVPQTYPYLPLAGGTHTNTAVVTYAVPAGAAPAAPAVRLDGGDNAKSAIDNWRIGGGVF